MTPGPASGRSLAVALLMAPMAILPGCGGDALTGSTEELPVSCLVKPDSGPCRTYQIRFYYDYRDDSCKAFNYGGCEGRVPFPTLESCVDFCGVAP